MKKYSFFLMIALIITSCSNLSEQELQETTSSGVVLIQEQSFYEMELSNGSTMYFTELDEEGDISGLTFDKDSIERKISYGTGFFISQNGEIATNAHVVSNITNDKDVKKSMSNILKALKKVISSLHKEAEEKLEQAQIAYDYANYSDEVSYDDFYKIRDIRDAIQEELQEYANLYNQLDDIDANESEITYHNEVSIAYNNTHVTNLKDFIPCVVTKTDPEHDLAIIQLKDKKTPTDKYVFVVPENDPLEEYSFMDKMKEDKNSKLFMSSFNLGPSLALTKEGIISQFNSGAISQKTTDRIMYSIPTLPGSSGSPVINHQGELVAVNFAGLNGTQNFNYGVRIKFLQELINK